MNKTINGMTVRDWLDDYSGRERQIENCHNTNNTDVDCKTCIEDRKEMEKIILMFELATI